MSKISISPKYTVTTPLDTIEQKIKVFEDQVRGWVLDHAHALASPKHANADHAAFAILMLVTSYFESVEAFYRGRPSKFGESRKFFKAGFLKVFPSIVKRFKSAPNPPKVLDDLLTEIYEQVRCGLYHEGTTKGKIVLAHGGETMEFLFEPANFSVVTVVLNPWSILDSIETHFTSFITTLNDPRELDLRASFEKCFDLRVQRRTTIIPAVLLGVPPERNTSTP